MSEKENNIIEEMFTAGAHFGYTKSRRHPTVKPYIFGNKNKIELFDLEKTVVLLEKAKAYATELGAKGATVLFIGGKNESQKAILRASDLLSMPYCVGRWIGGTLTNFGQIKKRVEKLVAHKQAVEKGELAKYTKWERMQMDRDNEKLERFFGGLVNLSKMPDAIFVVDTKREAIAVAEAKRKHIPVIALIGSDCDMKEITYPILGNDSSKKSIEFFTNQIVAAYEAGKKLGAEEKAKTKATVVAKE